MSFTWLSISALLLSTPDGETERQLAACMQRQIAGQSALLDRDADGRTLWELLSAPLHERDPAAYAVLRACAEPGLITQGEGIQNTCVVASLQYWLAQHNPAELARLVLALAGDGRARLRNGQEITRVEDSLEPGRYAKNANGKIHHDPQGPIPDPRSVADRLFQAAMMDYANGDDRYSDKQDRSTGAKRSYTGLYRRQQHRALEAVFAASFNEHSGTGGLDIVLETLARHPQPVLTDVRWLGSSHAILLERVEGGRVYFQNPYGPSTSPVASTRRDPVRRIEDAKGKESMTLDELRRVFERSYLPGPKTSSELPTLVKTDSVKTDPPAAPRIGAPAKQ